MFLIYTHLYLLYFSVIVLLEDKCSAKSDSIQILLQDLPAFYWIHPFPSQVSEGMQIRSIYTAWCCHHHHQASWWDGVILMMLWSDSSFGLISPQNLPQALWQTEAKMSYGIFVLTVTFSLPLSHKAQAVQVPVQ